MRQERRNSHNPIYIKFYKPDGVLTTFTDGEGRLTLSQFIPIGNVYTVGRLDMDSEGLLLLTNDGSLNHLVTSPGTHLLKTYYVQVEGQVTLKQLSCLAQGPFIKGDYKTLPCQVELIEEPQIPARSKAISAHHPTNWLKIRISEGKKRQIRHMTAAVGLPTLRLVRVAIGPLEIGDLKPGMWRYLLSEELISLKYELSRRLSS